jgi:aryl-alcohol dehydrogenase-like predicted oxidoreductase
MRYKTLGDTGLIVSELCFGTMTFGGDGFWKVIGAQDQAQACDLVRKAFDRGVNFFDTANIYANGVSEKMLGEAIRTEGLRRDEIVIATKAHGRMADVVSPDASASEQREAGRRASARNVNGLSRKHLFDSIDASLKRLGLDHVDLYQVHGYDPLTPFEEMVEALHDIVKSGRVRYVGFCNLSAWQAMKAIGIAKSRGLTQFQSAQMYYSIAGRDLEREIAPFCQDQKLALLPWSPLAGGFLSGKFQREGGGPNDARRAAFDFPPVEKERAFDCIDAMTPMAQARDCSVARIALAWLLHKPFVTSVIIGAKTPEQLEDNLAATAVTLSAAEMAKLDEVSALPREYPGWMLDRMSGDRAGQVS